MSRAAAFGAARFAAAFFLAGAFARFAGAFARLAGAFAAAFFFTFGFAAFALVTLGFAAFAFLAAFGFAVDFRFVGFLAISTTPRM